MAGSRATFALLVVAALVVTTSIVLDRFPEFTLSVLAHVMSGEHPDQTMSRGAKLIDVSDRL
jgi:hypothetical protein